ncbi:MAG: methyltransferase domain-containing protein [Candidatus Hodarchaeales archaeon]|jgi:2-polyprenyl-3-methyl-5-hydroxy-6-metoxy-1,4-benzoquinol methylase
MDEWIKKQSEEFSHPRRSQCHNKWTTNKVNSKVFQKLLKYAKPGMSFLDLGCNHGWACNEMKKKGLKETGVDLPAVIKTIKYNINTISMNLEEEFPIGQWDIILCREVIEHIRTYKKLCQNMINALTDNGIVLITSPNTKGNPSPYHCICFLNDDLNRLVKECGGEITESFNNRSSRVIIARKIKNV